MRRALFCWYRRTMSHRLRSLLLLSLSSSLATFVGCSEADGESPNGDEPTPAADAGTVDADRPGVDGAISSDAGADAGSDAGEEEPFVPNRVLPVGTGSGRLEVDGSSMALECNDQISIKGGTYDEIVIKNVAAADGCIVMITNDGLVEMVGQSRMTLENFTNVTLSGAGTAGIAKGFSLHDNTYRSVELVPPMNGFTLQHFAFRNIGDYVIHYDNSAQIYDGSAASFTKDLRFRHLDCDNTATLLAGSGNVDVGQANPVVALVQGLEIAYVSVRNSPTIGTVAWFGNVDGYDIHHNVVDNVNTANDNHNGIFSITGSGKFHHNRITHHQGNAIRAWTFSLGGSPKDVLIYDNIVAHSRKYSGFEVQSFERLLVPGKTTFANAKIFSNTCGDLNTQNDWVGVVADVYGLLGGTAEIFNNLGYQLRVADSNDATLIASQQGSTSPQLSHNLRTADLSAAGIVDENEFRLTEASPAKAAGQAHPLVITDFYGVPRGATPSIGAVE